MTHIKLPFVFLNREIIGADASVTISGTGIFPTILSNSLFSQDTSMLVDTPAVCRLSTT